MSNRTFPPKWIRNYEFVFLGIAVAFMVNLSGLPNIFAGYLYHIPFVAVLIVCAGLSGVVLACWKKMA